MRQHPQKRAARGRKSILRAQDMGRDGTRVKNDSEGILRVFLKRGKNAQADGTAQSTCYQAPIAAPPIKSFKSLSGRNDSSGFIGEGVQELSPAMFFVDSIYP